VEYVAVPDLVGQHWSDSLHTSLMPQLGLIVRTVAHQSVPAGQVISTDPPAGTKLRAGSFVTIVVSGGPAPTPPKTPTPPADAKMPPRVPPKQVKS
jgi:serine/threonine-protein kinase